MSKFALFGYKPNNKGEAKLVYQNEAIIDRLKALKVKSGKTTIQIAKECDVPESTITRIFSGKTPNPTISTVIAMTKVMGGTSADIFDDNMKVDVVSESPQVVIPTVDERLYNEIISIYKDLLKIKDKRINVLLTFVGTLIVALVLVSIF